MDLSAIDVQQKTFRERFRGYDPDDVEDFLDRVVETFRSLELQVKRQQERIDQLEHDLAETSEAEEAIKRTFVAAQRTTQEMVTEAEAQAATIVERAREESDRLTGEARAEAERARRAADDENGQLMRRTAQLRTAVADLQNRLRAFAEGGLVELESIQASIDLETQSISDILSAAADEADAASGPLPEPTAEDLAITEAGDADDADTGNGETPVEAAYLQRPRSQRPWDRPEGEAEPED